MRPTFLPRALALAAVAVLTTAGAATPSASAASPGVSACASGARVMAGTTAKEPALYSPNDAKK